MLNAGKSLVYFITSLEANGVTMGRLLQTKLIALDEEEEDLLEDALVEYRQAIEMVQMYGQILSGMMDAFASIISNNLNMVMKFLTSMTIILAIPTMFASFWGMNVGVPLLGKPLGFWAVGAISALAAGVSGYALWRRNMF